MFDWIFGEDVFVSYARRDGLRYAAGLSTALIDRGLSCRTDLWDTVPGRRLPLKLRLAIRSSYMLAIIATPAAAASQAVAAEIKEFHRTRRNIVVIDVEGAASGAIWHEHVVGLPFEVEPSTEALVSGSPSASVVARIVQSHSFLKKSQRLRRAFWITVAGIASLIAAGALTVALVRLEVEEQRQIGTALRLAAEARAERSRMGYVPLPQVAAALQAGRILMGNDMNLDAAAILSDGLEFLPEFAWTRHGSFSFRLAVLDAARERLFVGEGNGRVVIRDASSGDGVALLQHASEVRTLGLSGDGELVATGTADGQAFVWDVSGEPRVVDSFACPQAFGAATFSPDSSYVAMSCEESVVIRELDGDRDWSIPHLFPSPSIDEIGFSSNNRYLFVSETEEGYFRLDAWEVATGNKVPYETLRSALGSLSRRFEISPDGRFLASSCWDPQVPPSDCTVRVYDATSLELVSQMPQAGPTDNTFSADGRLLATMGGSDVRVWSTLDARLLSILSGVGVATVAFSAHGEHFAAANDEGALVVESTSGTVASAIPMTVDLAIHGFLLTAPLRLLTVQDDAITMWRAGGMQRRTGFANPGLIGDAEIAASGDRAVTYCCYTSEEGGVATVWDLNSGDLLFRSQSGIDDFALRADGEQFAILRYDEFEVWEIPEQRHARRLRAPSREAGANVGRVRQVVHHASHGWIGLLEPDNGGAELWLLESDKRLAVLPKSSVGLTQFSAEGRFLLVVGPSDSFVLNLTTLARRTISLPSAARPVGIFCLDSEADCLVTYHTEDATRILRTGSGETVLDIPERFLEVRFDKAARFAVALTSGNVRIWDLSSGEVLFARPSEGGVPVGFRRDDSQLVVAQGNRLEILRWRPHDLLDEGCRRISSLLALSDESRETVRANLTTACPDLAATWRLSDIAI